MKPFRVILYYCYAPIDNTETYRDEHHYFCVENNLLGRIIISPEGLNGTVSGTPDDCANYMNYVRSDARFSHVQFKIEEHGKVAFQKLHVRVKDEIVNSDLHVDPLVRTGKHLEPSEFKALLDDPEVVLVDMRSDYEHEVGKFKGAITFDMHNLRELPDHIHEIEHLKNRKIVTYCTGGIKCEKASAYLLDQGFTDVYQLHGGIIRYGLEEGGENFDGKCYVFDNRITVDVNTVNPSVISKCHICGDACDRMVNCANAECNTHVPICHQCGEKMEGTCSTACKAHPGKRAYDGTGYYVSQSNHYNPMQGLKSQKKNLKKLKLAQQIPA